MPGWASVEHVAIFAMKNQSAQDVLSEEDGRLLLGISNGHNAGNLDSQFDQAYVCCTGVCLVDGRLILDFGFYYQ